MTKHGNATGASRKGGGSARLTAGVTFRIALSAEGRHRWVNANRGRRSRLAPDRWDWPYERGMVGYEDYDCPLRAGTSAPRT
jgi:hypothetical protein